MELSTDKSRLDVPRVHRWLSEEAYWALGRPLAVTEAAIAGSLCFGGYDEDTGEQLAFARVVTDGALFAYLGDVFVASEARGQGAGKQLVEAILAHPTLNPEVPLRRIVLVTYDAHGLYEQYGFGPLDDPEGWLNLRPGG
jgi:GNAT superfamily N-acetyltransferase